MRKILLCLILAGSPLHADDDQFRERFADPATRTAALAELIPGTRAAHFHIALDHQLAGREADFETTMTEWKAASERKESPVSAESMKVLENRQILMAYQKNPVTSLAELIRRLDLKFTDTRPDAAAAENLPTRVDPALISEAAFEKSATDRYPKNTYTQYTGQRRLRELEQVEKFDEEKIRWFLENLDRADLPGVVPLIDRALGLDRTFSFTQQPLLAKLTAAQLESLLGLHPNLRAKESFSLAYLAKLRPGSETDFKRDPMAHAEHLRRCRDFVITLPPALNSLKAHVLFHHLRLQVDLGNYPKEDFLAFLALPRSRHELLKIPEIADKAAIRLDQDFTAATACPPVPDDLALIQSYLQHLLSATDTATEFAPFIPEKLLNPLHARARLLAGGDPARWGTLLDPAEFKSLQENARIDFAPGAPSLLDADAAVALTLDLKNTPDLLIRIYELDLPAHLTSHGSEPEVDIDLDGLVPHYERRLTFAQAPILLHRETIQLPELAGPGAWLVDFTGGQVSARALVRKGQLIAFPERTATGQTVRVFDEKGNAVPTASISLGRENLTADATGRIVIPDAPNQPVTTGIVRAGKLAAPISLGTRSDELAFDARFHLDREQLLADQEAKLHLRVRLTNHGHELPLDRIQDPALVLEAELLGGVTTERVIAENLTLTSVMEIPFQVPANLLKLTLTLRGTVAPANGGDPIKLSKDRSYEINGDLKEARIGTAFFSPTAEGHRLEVRGRNGEPLPSRAISLKFSRFDHVQTISLLVRTDSAGRVDLGKLDSSYWIEATGTDIAKGIYHANMRSLEYSKVIRVTAADEIQLPLDKPAATPDRLEFSLLETLNQKPIRDHFDRISILDGQVVIHPLPPGNFIFKQGDVTTEIYVSSGIERESLLISKSQVTPRQLPFNPVISRANVENGHLGVKVRAISPSTRISIVGRRFGYWRWDSVDDIQQFPPPVPDSLKPGFLGNGFLTNRRLGDEMRYILDRRSAKTFPGTLLPHAGLLLNRWTQDDLTQESRTSRSGEAGSSVGRLRRESESVKPDENQFAGSGAGPSTVTFDFLQFPSIVLFDLKPEADGSLKLPLAQFEGSQFIEIIATDAFASDTLILPLPANETPLRDRRIARPLDPQAHHLANRSAAVLQKGAEASIENLLDADWRAFTTLTEAHQFLFGMTGDDRLREFVFLTEWPTFPEAKKLELLSKHACHEFHLFLARKDPAFFEKSVKPLLAGKPEPQFMDNFLLGRDLTAYLRPYAWQRLNAAEKALLSQALPAARERIAKELSLRWQLEAPEPDAETTLFTQTLRGSDLALQDSLGLAKKDLREEEQLTSSDSYIGGHEASVGVNYITRKLQSIVIPRIDFEDTTVEEAIDFLRLRAAELDTTELDPAKKGVNFIIRRPRNGDDGDDPGKLRVRELRVRNVPLGTALKYICAGTKFLYKVDDFAVTIVPATGAGEDIFTRTFRVEPNFAASLDGGGDGSGAAADPFAEPSESPVSPRLTARKPIIELMKSAGINFAEDSSATLSGNGTLIITNTPSELDKVEQLTQYYGSGPSTGNTAHDAFDPGVLPLADPFAEPSAGTTALAPHKPILPPLQPSPTAPSSGARRIITRTPSPPTKPTSRSTASGWIWQRGMARGRFSLRTSTPATRMRMKR